MKVLRNLLYAGLLTLAMTPGAQAQLSGSPAATNGLSINLTTEGTADWTHWGLTAGTDFDHKSGANLISDETVIDGGYGPNQYGDNGLTFSWSDGTPTASASNTRTGIYTNGGFEFTAPADTTVRQLKVYLGGYSSGGTFTATLSDNSAAPYIDSSVSSTTLGATNDGTQHYYAVYTLTYRAASAGQTLDIKWEQTSGTGNITLQAATLSAGSATLPPAPTGLTAFAGDARAVLNFNTVPGADSYNILRSTTSGSGYTQIANVSTASYIDTGLSDGTTYYYVVQAVNFAGHSGNSAQVSVTPQTGVDGTGVTGNYYQNAALNSDNNGNPLFLPSDLAFTEIDPTINFDFLGGPFPNNTLPYGTNNFAVKWTGLVRAQVTGTYVFATASDDGSRLYLDGQLIVDNYFYQGTTTRYSAGINLVGGTFHTLRVQYFQGGGGATCYAYWAYPGQTLQIIPQYALYPTYGTIAPNPPVITAGAPGANSAKLTFSVPDNATSVTILRSTTAGGPYTTVATGVTGNTYTDNGLTNGVTYYYVARAVNANGTSGNSNEVSVSPIPPVIGNGDGLYGTYYNGDAQDYSPENTTPILYDIVPTINFSQGNSVSYNPGPYPAGVPVSHWTGVWTGQVQAPFTGAYVFQIISDDGSRLSLDTGSGLNIIIDNSNYQGPTAKNSATINLTAGQKYAIKLEFFQGGGGSTTQLLWNPLNSGFQIIPQTQLYSNLTTAPPAPTNLTATGGSHLVNLVWSSTQYAASYKILRGTTNGGPYTQIGTSVLPSFTDTTVTNGTTYYYVVQAVNNAGTSGNSNQASATPQAAALILHYTFENGPSGLDPDPITDTSGHSNDGYAVGGDVDFTNDAAQGVWAGKTIDNAHYLALPDGFDFGDQFTFFTLVKMQAGNNIQTILGTNGSGGSTPGFALYVNDFDNTSHAIVFETNQNSSGTNVQTKTRTAPGVFPLGDGQYHAVAAVVNRPAGTVSIYFDGKQVLADGVIDTTWPTASGANRLGLFPSGDEVAANSQFDDVRVYAGLLSPADVAAISGNSVTGRIALEGVNDLSAISLGAPLGTFHVSFRTPGTTTEVFGKDVTITPVGAGSPFGTLEVSGVPAGTYDVAIKGSKNLRNVIPNVTVSGATTLPDQTLLAGDADNNNIVDIGDFGILVNAYLGDFNVPGSGYDPTADFNFDGKNDIGDFGLLVNNFGTPGAP